MGWADLNWLEDIHMGDAAYSHDVVCINENGTNDRCTSLFEGCTIIVLIQIKF